MHFISYKHLLSGYQPFYCPFNYPSKFIFTYYIMIFPDFQISFNLLRQFLENIAFQKPSMHSSTHSYSAVTMAAHFGNDGNRDGRWEVCAWTKNDPIPPWWEVDLGRIASVRYVKIRSGSTWMQLKINPFHIAVGNDGSNSGVNNPKCVDSGTVLSGEIKRFDCPTIMQGRYVTLYLTRAEYLQVCELEVYE